MNSDAYWRLAVAEIVKGVRTGAITAAEVTRACLDRIEEIEPSLNAFTVIDREGALDAARTVDSVVRQGGEPGPLAGVPFTVKDLTLTKGLETTFGSHIFAGNVPTTDAEVVARMRRAGAILLGKTNTPEFGHKALTDNPRFGFTHNPWDTTRSPGGSSGGAAAAVATGMGTVALNTDGAGSARIPASACGVLGLKPTLGLLPSEHASELFSNFVCLGLNARSAADLGAALGAVAGPDRRDPWSMHVPVRGYAPSGDPVATLRGARILYVPRMGNRIVDTDVDKLMEAALRELENAGARIETGSDEFDWAKRAAYTMTRSYQRVRLERFLGEYEDRMDVTLVEALREGQRQELLDVQEAPARRSELFRRVQALFDEYDLIVTPTVAAPPPRFDHRYDEPIYINGELAGPIRENWYCYTGPFNLTGHPAISIPMGFCRDHLPAGFHAVGRWFDEQRLVDLASAFEQIGLDPRQWPPTAGGDASLNPTASDVE